MNKFKTGILAQDYDEMGRIYLKGTPVEYRRSKDYEEQDEYGHPTIPKWTGQFRTYYKCKDKDGIDGSFTVFYLDLLIEK